LLKRSVKDVILIKGIRKVVLLIFLVINMIDIKVKITDRDGVTHEVDAPTDMNMNLMELVRSYELAPEGTIGVCGGMAMCASCQCYVESDHSLPERSDDEEAMLAEAFYVQENSRLGCQIHLSADLDGLEVALAPES
jgi:2Fe-2S ferredoxin